MSKVKTKELEKAQKQAEEIKSAIVEVYDEINSFLFLIFRDDRKYYVEIKCREQPIEIKCRERFPSVCFYLYVEIKEFRVPFCILSRIRGDWDKQYIEAKVDSFYFKVPLYLDGNQRAIGSGEWVESFCDHFKINFATQFCFDDKTKNVLSESLKGRADAMMWAHDISMHFLREEEKRIESNLTAFPFND